MSVLNTLPCFMLLIINVSPLMADDTVALAPIEVTANSLLSSFVLQDAESATKDGGALRDVPFTVAAIPRDLFTIEGAHSLEDVLSSVAGVSPSLGDGQRDQVSIRGFSAINDEYVDGARDSEMYFRDLANVERVDLIQGPAAALYGRGSAGGLINRVTRKPTDKTLGEFDLTRGSWGETRAEFDAAGPLGGKGFGLPAGRGGGVFGRVSRRLLPSAGAPVAGVGLVQRRGKPTPDSERLPKGPPIG